MFLQGTIVPGRLRSELYPWGVKSGFQTFMTPFDKVKRPFFINWIYGNPKWNILLSSNVIIRLILMPWCWHSRSWLLCEHMIMVNSNIFRFCQFWSDFTELWLANESFIILKIWCLYCFIPTVSKTWFVFQLQKSSIKCPLVFDFWVCIALSDGFLKLYSIPLSKISRHSEWFNCNQTIDLRTITLRQNISKNHCSIFLKFVYIWLLDHF